MSSLFCFWDQVINRFPALVQLMVCPMDPCSYPGNLFLVPDASIFLALVEWSEDLWVMVVITKRNKRWVKRVKAHFIWFSIFISLIFLLLTIFLYYYEIPQKWNNNVIITEALEEILLVYKFICVITNRKINKAFLEKVISSHVSFLRIQKAGEDARWMTGQKFKVDK